MKCKGRMIKHDHWFYINLTATILSEPIKFGYLIVKCLHSLREYFGGILDIYLKASRLLTKMSFRVGTQHMDTSQKLRKIKLISIIKQ